MLYYSLLSEKFSTVVKTNTSPRKEIAIYDGSSASYYVAVIKPRWSRKAL